MAEMRETLLDNSSAKLEGGEAISKSKTKELDCDLTILNL